MTSKEYYELDLHFRQPQSYHSMLNDELQARYAALKPAYLAEQKRRLMNPPSTIPGLVAWVAGGAALVALCGFQNVVLGICFGVALAALRYGR